MRHFPAFSVYVAPIATRDRPAAADWEYGEIERFQSSRNELESADFQVTAGAIGIDCRSRRQQRLICHRRKSDSTRQAANQIDQECRRDGRHLQCGKRAEREDDNQLL